MSISLKDFENCTASLSIWVKLYLAHQRIGSITSRCLRKRAESKPSQKRPPSNMGEGGKRKFTFILGYNEYLEKTLRAHGNCTLFNARNRGTLIFSCERLFHSYIFISRLSQGADIFLFHSLVFHNYLRIAG